MLLGFVFQSPGPILWEVGPISVRWYGFLIAMAVLLGVTLSQYLAQKRAIDPDLIADLAIWLVVGAIPAARLYYVLFQWQEYAPNPADIIAIWKGGIAIHGAIIGGLLAALIFARINRVSLWQLLDLVAPSVILGQAIGRWGFIPPASRPLEYIAVDYFHPTFLYESLWNLAVFALLIYLFFWGLKHPSKLKIGTLTLVYFIAYSLGRFWIEGLRTDSLMFGPLKMAQIISLGAIAVGLFGLFWLYKLQRPLPDVVATVGYNQKLP